jgi:hypothetical protein
MGNLHILLSYFMYQCLNTATPSSQSTNSQSKPHDAQALIGKIRKGYLHAKRVREEVPPPKTSHEYYEEKERERNHRAALKNKVPVLSGLVPNNEHVCINAAKLKEAYAMLDASEPWRKYPWTEVISAEEMGQESQVDSTVSLIEYISANILSAGNSILVVKACFLIVQHNSEKWTAFKSKGVQSAIERGWRPNMRSCFGELLDRTDETIWKVMFPNGVIQRGFVLPTRSVPVKLLKRPAASDVTPTANQFSCLSGKDEVDLEPYPLMDPTPVRATVRPIKHTTQPTWAVLPQHNNTIVVDEPAVHIKFQYNEEPSLDDNVDVQCLSHPLLRPAPITPLPDEQIVFHDCGSPDEVDEIRFHPYPEPMHNLFSEVASCYELPKPPMADTLAMVASCYTDKTVHSNTPRFKRIFSKFNVGMAHGIDTVGMLANQLTAHLPEGRELPGEVQALLPYVIVADAAIITGYACKWFARGVSKKLIALAAPKTVAALSLPSLFLSVNIAAIAYVGYQIYQQIFAPGFVNPGGVALVQAAGAATRIIDPELGRSNVAMANLPEYKVCLGTDNSFESWLAWIYRRKPDLVGPTGETFFFFKTGRTVALPSTIVEEMSFWYNHPEPTMHNYDLFVGQVTNMVKKIQNIAPAAENVARVSGPAAIYMYNKENAYNKLPSVRYHCDRMLHADISWRNVACSVASSITLLATVTLVLKRVRQGRRVPASAINCVFEAVTNKQADMAAKYPPYIMHVQPRFEPTMVDVAMHTNNMWQETLGFNLINWLKSFMPGDYRGADGMDLSDESPEMEAARNLFSLYALVGAPFIEEFARSRLGWRFTAFICVVETVSHRNTVTVPLHCSMQVLHTLLPRWLALPITISYHMGWNAMALFAYPMATASCTTEWNKFKTYPPDVLEIPRVTQFKPSAVVRPPKFENHRPEKTQSKQYNIGLGTADYRPSYLLPSLANDTIALDARVLAATPVPNQFILGAFGRWFKRNIRSILPKTCRRKGFQPPTFDEYINRTNASPGVKRTLKAMNEKLKSEHIDVNTVLSDDQLRDYRGKSSFLKVENNCYRSRAGFKHKAGRLIQGSRPAYLCLVGPWIQRLQDYMKRDLNKNNFMCFTSGVSSFDCASLLMGRDGQLLENDISAWDSSLDMFFADLETWLVEYLGAPRAVIDLIKQNRTKHGRTFFGFKYRVDGTRASGEPFTSLFNSFWNMCIHLFVYCFTQGMSVQQARTLIIGLFQGDDGAMNLPHGVNINWVMWFRFFGFTSKAVYRANPLDLEFCSMRLYPVLEGWCFGPKIGKVLSKLGFFVMPPLNTNPLVLMRGVCLGLAPSGSFLKPLAMVLDRIMTLTSSVHANAMRREEWQMSLSKCTPTTDTESAVSYHYGVGTNLLNALKNELEVPLGDDRRKHVYNYLCDKDTSAPQFYLH